MFVKYIGITRELAVIIEQARRSPEQGECDILLEILIGAAPDASGPPPALDLGQGVHVYPGEKLLLFLDERAKAARNPHGSAEVRADGLYVEDAKVRASRGSLITPAMRHFQRALGHLNSEGEPISLNAYRQWHVVRDKKLVALVDLKDQSQARRRGARLSTTAAGEKLLADLGIVL